MQTKSRVFNSEIIIDEQDHWFYRGNEIIHPSVLDFFRENLYEDEKGIYIQNIYGAFSERGYIECNGFPVFFYQIIPEEKELKLKANNKKIFSALELNFFYDSKERLFAIPKDQKFIKYGFSKTVLNQISNYLQLNEKGEYTIVYANETYDVRKFESQFEVSVPIIL